MHTESTLPKQADFLDVDGEQMYIFNDTEKVSDADADDDLVIFDASGSNGDDFNDYIDNDDGGLVIFNASNSNTPCGKNESYSTWSLEIWIIFGSIL